jgi:hypothetical protein
MRWPRRGILIRLLIYVPVIALLAWRAQGGCSGDEPAAGEGAPLEQKLAPHRRVITLPDGTQQEVVELTAEEAEAILGVPIPRNLDEAAKRAEAREAKAGPEPEPEPEAEAEPGMAPEAKAAGD